MCLNLQCSLVQRFPRSIGHDRFLRHHHGIRQDVQHVVAGVHAQPQPISQPLKSFLVHYPQRFHRLQHVVGVLGFPRVSHTGREHKGNEEERISNQAQQPELKRMHTTTTTRTYLVIDDSKSGSRWYREESQGPVSGWYPDLAFSNAFDVSVPSFLTTSHSPQSFKYSMSK